MAQIKKEKYDHKTTKLPFNKTKTQIAKLPKSLLAKFKILKSKYDLRGQQEVFDLLVIGGLVYFNKDIMDVVEEGIPFYKERHARDKQSRFGKVSPPVYPKSSTVFFKLYPRDMAAFSNFAIEKNYAKQWMIETLFKAFVEEDQRVTSFIERGKGLKITERKNAIARISNDKWIQCLDPDICRSISKQLTENYEKGLFGSMIQNEVNKLVKNRKRKLASIAIDVAWEDKQREIAEARAIEMEKVSDPREEP